MSKVHSRPVASAILRTENLENGRIIKEVLKEGEGILPMPANEVFVHYTGWLSSSGKQFDSSRDRDDMFKFQLGTGSVIKGWDVGVASMAVGERAVFTIASEYGYGEAGAGVDIPPNSELCFDVELFDAKEKKKEKYEMSSAEKLKEALELKEQGNAQISESRYSDAANSYREVLSLLELDNFEDEEGSKAASIVLSSRLNLSNALLKLSLWRECIEQCNKILDTSDLTSSQRVKALFRRAAASMNIEEFAGAKQDLRDAAKLEPQNSLVRCQMEELKKKTDAANQKLKKTFGGMFGKVGELYCEKKDVALPVEHDLSKLPKVFMDVKVGESEPQRMTFALYEDSVPKTAENFKALCTGEKGEGNCHKPLCYKNAIFHRVIKGFMMQGGDFENSNGTGGESIYGSKFDDEDFRDQHERRGLLSMANSGPNTNGSQFFVLFDKAPHLDGKHVVFGELVEGWDVLDAVEKAETGEQDKPKEDIRIVDCGLVTDTESSSVGA